MPRPFAAAQVAPGGPGSHARFVGRRDRPADERDGPARKRESGPRVDKEDSGRTHSRGARSAHSPRTDGLRAEALSGSQAENDRRDSEYDGRDSEEHPLPRDQETADNPGGIALAVSGCSELLEASEAMETP